MTGYAWVLDGALAVTLVGLAWQVLSTTNLLKAILYFIAAGLLMALIWVRLEAVDIALAEAAIGAGLTGVLFLTTLSYLESNVESGYQSRDPSRQEPPDHDTK